jgi:hypothetical protein
MRTSADIPNLPIQTSNHRQRQRPVSTQDFIDALSFANNPQQSLPVLAPLFESKLDCIFRIWHIDRELCFFVLYYKSWGDTGTPYLSLRPK